MTKRLRSENTAKILEPVVGSEVLSSAVDAPQPDKDRRGALSRSAADPVSLSSDRRVTSLQDIVDFKNDPLYSDVQLCALSGCARLVTMACSKCKAALYCSEDHRIKHWSAEGHSAQCVPQIVYDPFDDPIPGTFGPRSAPPEDLWNPDLLSVCFDLKVYMEKWPGVYGGENKLFLVRNRFKLGACVAIIRTAPLRCD